jgi:precorrin-3B synthase
MSAPMRRGACPALTAPMRTGDGLLVRLTPASGGVSPAQLIGLAQAASRHGSGTVEVTARGNLQFRGLTETSAPAFASDVGVMGIDARDGVPIDVSPLAGLDGSELIDPRPLARAIRSGCAQRGLPTRLGPKVSVVIDGGGSVSLDDSAADVRLTADGRGWLLAIAGDARSARLLGVVDGEAAAASALAILDTVADMGPTARARDLPSGWIEKTVGQIQTLRNVRPANAGDVWSTRPLLDGRFVLAVALPFGSTDAQRLRDLAGHAQAIGVSDIRPSPLRMLLALCPSIDAAHTLQRQAAGLGFITVADDPRLTIAACAGRPACASGRIDTRAIAVQLAGNLGPSLGGRTVHVSGCAKGCAHPAAADVTIVGDENGIGLVAAGTAAGQPHAYTTRDSIVADAARLLDRTEALAPAARVTQETAVLPAQG